jgi:hypothetical protein
MKVKITKIKEAESPKYRSAQWDEWKLGQDNVDVSLPIEYELEGTIVQEAVIGNSLVVARTKRNGVPSIGMFATSKIQDITTYKKITVIETMNSVYWVEEIEDENEI